jgi:hypothetical protein
MFMTDAPPELEAKLRRLQCRDLVYRNVLALSAGVRKTAYWDFTHAEGPRDDVMTLMYGKLKLEEFANGTATHRYPAADALRLMSATLGDAESVQRVELPDRPSVYLFEAKRRGRAPVWVVWERRDAFSGEDASATQVDWSFAGPAASATDVFGAPVPAAVASGKVSLAVSDTPVFVEIRAIRGRRKPPTNRTNSH